MTRMVFSKSESCVPECISKTGSIRSAIKEVWLVIVDEVPVSLEYYTVMDYGKRLLLRFLCLLITRLYVVVFTACPEAPFTDSSGAISSPGFNTSSQYDYNLKCTYRIIVPANRRVILEVKNLSILGVMPDCDGDSLEILVG